MNVLKELQNLTFDEFAVDHILNASIVGMAKFRNVLVHLYLEVDLQKVYYYLQNDLEDFERYMRYVSEYLAGLERQL